MTADEIGRLRRKPVVLTFRPLEFDGHVLAFDKACFAQLLVEPADNVPGLAGRAAT